MKRSVAKKTTKASVKVAPVAVSNAVPEDGKSPSELATTVAPVKKLDKAAAAIASGTKRKSTDKSKDKVVREKAKKPKLVRDSFAMPENEYEVLRDLKKTCMKAGVDIKKSELLRVGVALLKKQTPAEIQSALSELVPLKAGRPKKAE